MCVCRLFHGTAAMIARRNRGGHVHTEDGVLCGWSPRDPHPAVSGGITKLISIDFGGLFLSFRVAFRPDARLR